MAGLNVSAGPVWPRDRARDFLAAFLEDGARTSREIWTAAEEQGLSARTVERAKKGLNIQSVRAPVDGRQRSYWLLPGQELPQGITPDVAEHDLEPWLAPLRERYPAATPLDDL